MPREARWLIVGADGTIGAALARRVPLAVRTTRRAPCDSAMSLDLASDPATWRLPDGIQVAFLCAAVTSIDRCRQSPIETRLVNVTRTVQLASRLRSRGAHIVFLSTNQIFDGSRPFMRPDDPPNPQSEYGRQKAEAERMILADGDATVVRFTKVVPPHLPLLRVWADALLQHQPIEPFDDMVMSPVPLSCAVDVLNRVGERTPGGIVQVSGDIDVSYARIALRLAARCRAAADLVHPVSCASRGIPGESAPRHTTLDTTRLSSELHLTVPPVATTLDTLIEGLFHG